MRNLLKKIKISDKTKIYCEFFLDFIKGGAIALIALIFLEGISLLRLLELTGVLLSATILKVVVVETTTVETTSKEGI